MRNLKKVLSLVLVFAMACTMMAGAAFNDQKNITNTDAVNMLTALNIIKGGTDGNFNPEKVVTRAEMAKMIYVLKNSGNDDGATYYKGALAGPNGKPVFSDVTGHWAQGYINWAYSLNIINGRGNGKFDPDASVTGLEAAKMLLTVIGYKPATEGMSGTTWAIKTAALASEADLFDNYTPAFNAGCPRDFAAQIIYNAIFAKTIVYRDGIATSVGSDNTDNKTLGEKAMGLIEVTGTLAGNSKFSLDGNTPKDGEVRIVDAKDKNNVALTPSAINFTFANLDMSLVGQEVKVLYKESKSTSKGNSLDTNDTVYGITPTGKTKSYELTKGDMDDADGEKIDIGDTTLKLLNEVTVYTNFVSSSSDIEKPATLKLSDYTGATAAKDYAVALTAKIKADNADKLQIVTDSDNKVKYVFVTKTKFAYITGITSAKVSFAGKTMDIEDIKLYSGAAKDAVVAYTSLYNSDLTNDDAVVTVNKADTVDVKVASIRDGGKEVKINDSYAKVASGVTGVFDTDDFKKDSANLFSSNDLDDTYTFVMYGKYWVAAKTSDTSVEKVAVIEKIDANTSTTQNVKVMLSDGTEKVYVLHKDSDTAIKTGASTLVGTVCNYSIQSNGEIKLTQPTGEFVNKSISDNVTVQYFEKSKKFSIGGTDMSTNDDTVVFVKYGTDDWKVFLSDDLKDFTNLANTVVSYKKDGSKVAAIYVQTASKPGNSSSNETYGMVLANPNTTKINGDTYVQLSVWNGTETVTLTVDTASLTDLATGRAISKKDLIVYKVGSGDKVNQSDIQVVGYDAVAGYAADYKTFVGAVKEYSAKRQTITIYDTVSGTTGTTYAIADDVKIIYVDSDNKKGETSGSVQEAIKDNSGNWTNNVAIVYDNATSAKEVKAIFVDIQNELKRP